mmetsp:Transcript_57249/g.162515  ORF Transcript_57249/g.162515 Transcript_57249/m.162515 type:complete len:209 (-) Transcript_57249:706-1332(-)
MSSIPVASQALPAPARPLDRQRHGTRSSSRARRLKLWRVRRRLVHRRFHRSCRQIQYGHQKLRCCLVPGIMQAVHNQAMPWLQLGMVHQAWAPRLLQDSVVCTQLAIRSIELRTLAAWDGRPWPPQSACHQTSSGNPVKHSAGSVPVAPLSTNRPPSSATRVRLLGLWPRQGGLTGAGDPSLSRHPGGCQQPLSQGCSPQGQRRPHRL